MLVLATAQGAKLDAGSVGLALVRRWSREGERLLFVDADTRGSRLAERLGEAMRANYSPVDRGLPSLMAAREPLTLELLAGHCYSLATPSGSVWALFAPLHPAGAEHAVDWLAERSEELMEVGADRDVVLATSWQGGGERLAPLLSDVPVVAMVGPAQSRAQARALGAQCRDAGLMDSEHQHLMLMVEGHSKLGDEEIHVESGLRVVGRLPVIDDLKVLRMRGGRKHRAFVRVLDEVVSSASALLSLKAAADEVTSTGEIVAELELETLGGSLEQAAVNGDQQTAEQSLDRASGTRHKGRL